MNNYNSNRGFFYLMILLSAFFLLLFVLVYTFPYSNNMKNLTTIKFYNVAPSTIECFQYKNVSLPDISDINPRKGKSIFFHETSCRSTVERRIITSRQACAVESAAKLNPNMDVYLLLSSPVSFNFVHNDLLLPQLLTYKNVKILHADYGRYLKGTPVEELFTSGKIENSDFAVAHASDIIRYVSLYKYGGVYLDLDVLMLKSLEEISLNYAGIESADTVAAGVLSFEPTGKGHIWAERCLNDLKENFDGHAWSESSTGIITRLLTSLCNTTNTEEMVDKECEGYKVYPQKTFYPITWQDWPKYFSEENLENVLELSKESIALHMWNKLTEEEVIPLTSQKVPYLYFARQFCPQVVSACHQYF